MGPDEVATRHELNLVFRLLVAKIEQNFELISDIGGALRANGALTQEQFDLLVARTKASPGALKANQANERLREFLTIRNIDQLFQDPPEE